MSSSPPPAMQRANPHHAGYLGPNPASAATARLAGALRAQPFDAGAAARLAVAISAQKARQTATARAGAYRDAADEIEARQGCKAVRDAAASTTPCRRNRGEELVSRHSRTKPSEHDRAARHGTFELLLPRLKRGVLTREERALLAAYIREEVRLGEKTRRSLNRTRTRLVRHREAAADAICELERSLAEQRAALSEAAGLGNDASWEAIRDRVAELARSKSARDTRRGRPEEAESREHDAVIAGNLRRVQAVAPESERARTALLEVLDLFSPVHVAGEVAFYQATETPIAPDDYERWHRAALSGDGPQYAVYQSPVARQAGPVCERPAVALC